MSLPVVFAVADAVPVRYRAPVLLATFASMRWGELVGLRRENIDLAACGIRMADRRTVSFPAELVPELRWHLERFSEPGERGLVFVGPKGAPLRRSNFRPIWNSACATAGRPGLHFHDLRHVGGTLAERPGVASDATFPGKREDGAVRDSGPCSARPSATLSKKPQVSRSCEDRVAADATTWHHHLNRHVTL